MKVIYDFPQSAFYGKVVPKTKIYEHGSVSAAVKKLFVSEVGKIIWAYKLSPETINLPMKNNVHEIQVFIIELKNGTLKHDVLKSIDKAIPSHIIFQLVFESKIKYITAYKRISEADKKKWVISSYFETNWININAKKINLPVVLDISSLYEKILISFINLDIRDNESIEQFISRLDLIKLKKKELSKLNSKLHNEKQFNRKVEINSSIRTVKQEIEQLKII